MDRITAVNLVVAGVFAVTPVVVLSGQAPSSPFKPHPSTQEPGRLVTLDKLKQWEKELSNWGRWGKDDERGLLNLITPEKTKQALALVKEGKTVTLQINPIKKTGSDTGGFGENVHRMARIDPKTGAILGALDIIQLSIHDGLNSHLDALCHYQGPIGRKPGRAGGELQRVPLHADRGRMPASRRPIAWAPATSRAASSSTCRSSRTSSGSSRARRSTSEDLEAWEKFAGIKIGAGDALLIRGGRWAKRAADGPWAIRSGRRRPPCVGAAVAARARRVAARQRCGERRAAVGRRGDQPADSPAHAGEHGAADRRQRATSRTRPGKRRG